MPKALDEIAKEAMDLPPRQRLALAEFLLESADERGSGGPSRHVRFTVDKISGIGGTIS